MVQSKFVDDTTIEVIAPDGEKFTWDTDFPTPETDQPHYTERLAHYIEQYFNKNMGNQTGMSMYYWVWIQMNFYEGLGIRGGKGDRDEERLFVHDERVRIGASIRELRNKRNMEAKVLAQKAGIDAANLSRIERGLYSVGLDVLAKIALVLGAKIELADSGEL
jgi:DNA-binding XRE family transcriptional regulator